MTSFIGRKLVKVQAARKAAEAEAERQRQVEAEKRRLAQEAKRLGRKAGRAMTVQTLAHMKRGPGRVSAHGVSRREVRAMAEKAEYYLGSEEGIREFERDVKRTALMVMLIDGLLGTQPWRAAPALSAAARVRYMENAARFLEDLRAAYGSNSQKLLEDVIDVEAK